MGRMYNISDEERERRRQNALSLKAQGRIGPQFGKLGGRPKTPRASVIIAEKVSQEGTRIYERLMNVVESGMDANSIRAAQTLLKVEEQERQIEEKEVVNLEQAKRNELLAIVAEGLRELQDSGITLDGWSVELIDSEPSGDGESTSGNTKAIEREGTNN
jgi:hypothetical protein